MFLVVVVRFAFVVAIFFFFWLSNYALSVLFCAGVNGHTLERSVLAYSMRCLSDMMARLTE